MLDFETILGDVRSRVPLVHNITNYVTVNDCANILLACGGSPIMSDDEGDVEDITAICGGLNINIGTLNRNTIPSMFLAGKRANALNHPVLLDPVGAGASKLRTETAAGLIEEVQFAVIRGNISEIKALGHRHGWGKNLRHHKRRPDHEPHHRERLHALCHDNGVCCGKSGQRF